MSRENFGLVKEWLTPKECAVLIPGHPSDATVRNWIHKGHIPKVKRTFGNRYLIHRSFVEEVTHGTELG